MKRFLGPVLASLGGALLGAHLGASYAIREMGSTLLQVVEVERRLAAYRAGHDLELLVALRRGETGGAIETLERRIDDHIERLEGRGDSPEVAEALAELRAYRDAAPAPIPTTPDDATGVSRLLASARVLPVFESGEMVGLRVSRIAPDGPWAALGARDGDVVVRIGDVALDSPVNSVALLELLEGGREVDLRRVGEDRVELIPR